LLQHAHHFSTATQHQEQTDASVAFLHVLQVTLWRSIRRAQQADESTTEQAYAQIFHAGFRMAAPFARATLHTRAQLLRRQERVKVRWQAAEAE
jgi:hypothetical protein